MAFSTSDESGVELMKNLCAGRVVFFAGVGISMDSCLPDAMELIDPVARHYFSSRVIDVNGQAALNPEGVPGLESLLMFGRDIIPEELDTSGAPLGTG